MSPDRLREIARSLFESAKAGDDRTLGEQAIGILAFQQLGNRCDVVSRAEGSDETWVLRLERARPPPSSSARGGRRAGFLGRRPSFPDQPWIHKRPGQRPFWCPSLTNSDPLFPDFRCHRTRRRRQESRLAPRVVESDPGRTRWRPSPMAVRSWPCRPGTFARTITPGCDSTMVAHREDLRERTDRQGLTLLSFDPVGAPIRLREQMVTRSYKVCIGVRKGLRSRWTSGTVHH